MATGGNLLYYGDNLDVLREHVATESVDLIYLDPPFNSNRSYNVLFRATSGQESQAQIEAFDDTWHWSQQAEQLYESLVAGGAPIKVADAIEAMRKLLGPNDVLAYLVMMAARLVELHRVLKPTGSLYLHCDPTASHYLKVVLDAIFGPEQFLNEVIWQRTSSKGLMTQRLAANHDVLLSYRKGPGGLWNADAVFAEYDEADLDHKTLEKYAHRDEQGRRYQLTSLINPNENRPNLTYEFLGVTRVWRWTRERMEKAYEEGRVIQPRPGAVPREKRYLDEQRGKPLGDVWTDIPPINSRAAERLGYPTQKPLALLERIIAASSNEGDVVLDPFCGCGTTIDAAQKLGRRWIGIDVTYLAVDLIRKRLRHTYGPDIEGTYKVRGIPTDVEGAMELFRDNPFDFERWAVSLVNAQPNQKQVGDRGVDGRVRFHSGKNLLGTLLVSVKGGRQLNPAMVRDLAGTVGQERAEMGLLITLDEPTRGMREVTGRSGTYVNEFNGNEYPKLQIVTVPQLLAGAKPKMPEAILPYVQAKARSGGDQLSWDVT
ncbi:MAG: restriction endonuclease subunit M [Actinomycetota bacterium]|nr:restriction endonuclease subunit M [Actinomycetota bacterium]